MSECEHEKQLCALCKHLDYSKVASGTEDFKQWLESEEE